MNSSPVGEHALAKASPTNTKIQHNVEPAVGFQIEVFWPLENAYYPSTVGEEQNRNKTVVYDDGGIETLYFSTEIWLYASSAKLHAPSSISLALNSNLNDVLMLMFRYFWKQAVPMTPSTRISSICTKKCLRYRRNRFHKNCQTCYCI